MQHTGTLCGEIAGDTNSKYSTSDDFQSVLQGDGATVGPFVVPFRFVTK